MLGELREGVVETSPPKTAARTNLSTLRTSSIPVKPQGSKTPRVLAVVSSPHGKRRSPEPSGRSLHDTNVEGTDVQLHTFVVRRMVGRNARSRRSVITYQVLRALIANQIGENTITKPNTMKGPGSMAAPRARLHTLRGCFQAKMITHAPNTK